MTPISELSHKDFTADRFGPIFEAVAKESGRPFEKNHFFETWKTWLWTGQARAWGNESCVLGALFTLDLFSGQKRAFVIFWFSLPEVRRTGLSREVFELFESAARAAGCLDIQSAAHELLDPLRRESGYLRNGFRKTETIYTKVL